ncbi:hypothetical protein [Curtobacterium sp. SORGH_AS_0776]|uniref:hypothetical protein n=1 Tax=Curtobacterium sp. SORGH_AS_0776 TaxID=3041798 RepID=UPI00285A7E78|nr:hypothetical protein [Curtobacterium sp. SORGH_AS_0776]MDR6170703.1 hypothetical protein [Curtobacterium sp. SORGH_AS_0776]
MLAIARTLPPGSSEHLDARRCRGRAERDGTDDPAPADALDEVLDGVRVTVVRDDVGTEQPDERRIPG